MKYCQLGKAYAPIVDSIVMLALSTGSEKVHLTVHVAIPDCTSHIAWLHFARAVCMRNSGRWPDSGLGQTSEDQAFGCLHGAFSSAVFSLL